MIKNFYSYFGKSKITNVINEPTEIEPTEISYEVKKLIDNYIVDVKTKGINYNLFLKSKPKLVIEYLEKIGYKVRPFPSYMSALLKCTPFSDKENLIELDFYIDYLESKSYLLNTKPHY